MIDLIEIYRKAIDNEEFLDFKIAENYHLKSNVKFKILRFNNFYKTFPVISQMLFWTINRTWFLLNFLIQTVFLVKILLKRKKIKPVEFDKTLVLAASGRITELIEVNKLTSIECLEIGKCKIKESENSTVFDSASLTQIFRAYWHSLFIYKEFGKNQKLYSIEAIEFITCYYVLTPIRFEKIYFCNHYDRWAILFSYLNAKEIVLLQHGIFSKDFLPNKLKKVDKLILLSSQEEKLVDNFIENIGIIVVNKTKLKLVDVPNFGKISILVVCNDFLYSKFEEEVYDYINYKNVLLIFKPHPLNDKTRYLNRFTRNNTLIYLEKNQFPKVDLVISYNSTLGMNYEDYGYNVVFHEGVFSESIINAINKTINSDSEDLDKQK